jgi:DnaJ family protein C protein 11
MASPLSPPPPPDPADRSLYAVLNVRADATEEEVRRAYRQLAATYHPDKARDPAAREDATRAFARLQDAYAVLSDPARRDVYDVYGAEGLAAGMELSGPARPREEMRAEFEAFRAAQRRDRLEASVNHRGAYVFRVDATAAVSPYARDLPRAPEITNIYMTSGVDVPVDAARDWGPLASEQDVLHLGGLVSVRGDAGGGSFLAGYKRSYADHSTLELHAAAGLKSLVSLSSSVALSEAAGASLVATWQPSAGPGLQLVTSRQLSEAWAGELSWVVGPRAAAGVAVGLTRRTEAASVSARLEVGAATGVALRAVRRLGEASSARVGAKLGTSGVELDVGGSRRLSEVSSAGLSVVVGLQGVLLRLRYTRAGHLFEFPVLLSKSLDPGVVAGAYLLPPLAIYAAKEWVLGPVARRVAARRARAARAAAAAQIAGALAEAAAASRLMAPVAARRVRKEAGGNGLVVVLALYGEEGAVKAAAGARLRAAAAAAAAPPPPRAAAVASSGGGGSPEGSSSSRAAVAGGGGGVKAHPLADVAPAAEPPPPPPAAAAAPQEQPSEPQAAQGLPPAGEGAEGDGAALPPALADVTVAVQYLCEGGRVVLHQGFAKSALMGFCDPAPGAAKALLVFYTFKVRASAGMGGSRCRGGEGGQRRSC